MREPELSTGRKVLLAAILLVGLPLVLLVILEGASSFLLLARDLSAARGTTERLHTEYDTLLGWIHRPDVDLDDIYGPGTRLRTNARRVRSIGPTPRERPDGIFRIICAGGSFTLGYGVSDERTWCHLLQDSAEGVETVNMGQGGYGLEQAYLWYVRDGLPLEHDALVFAFISDDFRRTLLEAFEGYPKPRFRVVDGRIELDCMDRMKVLRSDIPAVTHVDDSARIQTVRRETNTDYYDLIAAFQARTGCAVLVNTSFNVRGEPIVCTPYDAYRCFMRTDMDCLVVGPFLLLKDEQPPWEEEARWQDRFELD